MGLIIYLFIDKIKYKEILFSFILISSISFITIILDNSNRPDGGLYHLPFISILNTEKIIFGITNIHFRFGHISSMQYVSSIFNNYIFSEKGIAIPLSIIYSVSIIFFFREIKNQNIILKLYSFFCFVFILTSMNRYSGFGNDDPANFFYLITLYYVIQYLIDESVQKNIIFNKILVFSLKTFLIKQFFILILLFPLMVFLREFKKIKLLNLFNTFCFCLVILWIVKNIIFSSCMLYPVKFTCIDKFEWKITKSKFNAKEVSISSEAWAKGFPHRSDKKITEEEYISDYGWLSVWFENHYKVIVKELYLLVLIMIIFFGINFFNKKNKLNIQKKKLVLLLLINFLFVIIWLFKFPTYRYGGVYLGSLLIITSIVFFQLKKFNKVLNNLILIVVTILSLSILLKNFVRIYENYNSKYYSYPWPKIYSFTNKNYKNVNKPIYQNNELIYYHSYPYVLCMYSKGPCTHFTEVKIYKKTYLNFYKVFINKKSKN